MIRSKYRQGTLRSKWRIQQCQGEKDCFKILDKDCDTCRGKSYCYTNRVRPYEIKVESTVVVFADTYENAREYAGKGHGWCMGSKSVNGLPIKIKREGNKVSMDIDFDNP
jgi:hypothetical protein